MKIKDLEWGAAVLEVILDEKHLQPFGYVHGGVIASVMDAAAFWAVFLQVKDKMGLTTIEIKVSYLAPVQNGGLLQRVAVLKQEEHWDWRISSSITPKGTSKPIKPPL